MLSSEIENDLFNKLKKIKEEQPEILTVCIQERLHTRTYILFLNHKTN